MTTTRFISSKISSRQQTYVVDDALLVILLFVVKVCVPQHLAHLHVMVSIVQETIEVAVQGFLDHGKDKDLPQIHTGAAAFQADIWPQSLFQDLEYLLPADGIAIQMLQTTQHGGDIIP